MASEPVDRLAAEAEEARGKVASTIDAIQDRLSPRRLMGDAVDRVTGGGRSLIEGMGGSARSAMQRHPLAIGAAVAAVGLALLARRSLANARVDLGDDLGDYTDYDDGFGFETAPADGAGADDASDDDTTAKRPSAAASAADRLRAGTGAARALAANAGAQVEANPLLSIILGLAAGAALGALFPTTEAERRLIETSGGDA